MTSPKPNEERDGLVERFELDEGGFLGSSGKMVPDAHGDWVRFEDWLIQAAEITRLRAEVERMIGRWRERTCSSPAMVTETPCGPDRKSAQPSNRSNPNGQRD
jgi:hypothetical protein